MVGVVSILYIKSQVVCYTKYEMVACFWFSLQLLFASPSKPSGNKNKENLRDWTMCNLPSPVISFLPDGFDIRIWNLDGTQGVFEGALSKFFPPIGPASQSSSCVWDFFAKGAPNGLKTISTSCWYNAQSGCLSGGIMCGIWLEVSASDETCWWKGLRFWLPPMGRTQKKEKGWLSQSFHQGCKLTHFYNIFKCQGSLGSPLSHFPHTGAQPCTHWFLPCRTDWTHSSEVWFTQFWQYLLMPCCLHFHIQMSNSVWIR